MGITTGRLTGAVGVGVFVGLMLEMIDDNTGSRNQIPAEKRKDEEVRAEQTQKVQHGHPSNTGSNYIFKVK